MAPSQDPSDHHESHESRESRHNRQPTQRPDRQLPGDDRPHPHTEQTRSDDRQRQSKVQREAALATVWRRLDLRAAR